MFFVVWFRTKETNKTETSLSVPLAGTRPLILGLTAACQLLVVAIELRLSMVYRVFYPPT